MQTEPINKITNEQKEYALILQNILEEFWKFSRIMSYYIRIEISNGKVADFSYWLTEQKYRLIKMRSS